MVSKLFLKIGCLVSALTHLPIQACTDDPHFYNIEFYLKEQKWEKLKWLIRASTEYNTKRNC